ncbi:HAMP domain-containing sensor histidine kinase [Flavobacterium sp. SUN052]|uniref:sensor histidine kinase n=1 Tax=Flavobacterium sp. SUN052 TaxID=3002441 RepID=UPI00237E25AF|nr:HAMP domain-containing sensor histidine kinase [Flavobacterium sp. SUN052]MEC4004998.1 HAMP domain-containing sensor histidine kinase [Flavobacterium sp. SUN052]
MLLLKEGNLYTRQAYKSLDEAQVHYKNYINKNNKKKSLLKYFSSIKELKMNLRMLNSLLDNSTEINSKKSQSQKVNQKIDSILNNQSVILNNNIDKLKFETFDYNNILKSVSVDSIITNDSVARKGLISRILLAISGKYDIKKEKLKVILSYKYLNQLKSNDVKKTIENLLKESDAFYKKEINKSRSTFFITNKDELNLYSLNNNLLDESHNLLNSYNDMINSLKDDDQKRLYVIYNNYAKNRNYVLIFLVLLMLIFSGILFYFTRLAFDFEKKILIAKAQIFKSLNYKNRIIGMISHEIRSPLNILAIYSRKISLQTHDNEVKEVFTSIESTIGTLMLLVNQILEYSKNESKKMELKNSSFDLKQEIAKIVTNVRSLAENKTNKLIATTNIPDDFIVNSDIVKINQLYYNIIGNAIKFTENGTIIVNSILTKTVSNNFTLSVDVTDDGIGIPDVDLDAIFEDYYQGSPSKNIDDIGAGLGLKLCNDIIKLFNGTISVKSDLNEGTKVNFKIIIEKND